MNRIGLGEILPTIHSGLHGAGENDQPHARAHESVDENDEGPGKFHQPVGAVDPHGFEEMADETLIVSEPFPHQDVENGRADPGDEPNGPEEFRLSRRNVEGQQRQKKREARKKKKFAKWPGLPVVPPVVQKAYKSYNK